MHSPPWRLRGHNPQAWSTLRVTPAPPGGLSARAWVEARASDRAVVAGAGGNARFPARPPPARRLRWLGGGSAGLLLPAVLTCTQRRVTGPASPPQPAASRRSVSAPVASATLRRQDPEDTASSTHPAPGNWLPQRLERPQPPRLFCRVLPLAPLRACPNLGDISFVFLPRLLGPTDRRREVERRAAGSGKVTTRCAAGAGVSARGGRPNRDAATATVAARRVSLARREVAASLASGGTMGWVLGLPPSHETTYISFGEHCRPPEDPGNSGDGAPLSRLAVFAPFTQGQGRDGFLIATGSWKGEGSGTPLPGISENEIRTSPQSPTPNAPCRGGGGCSLRGIS